MLLESVLRYLGGSWPLIAAEYCWRVGFQSSTWNVAYCWTLLFTKLAIMYTMHNTV